ncbi:hypothetical protein BB559_003224 [Furculomyces boomerangus]|uniref:Arrestin-like N-terminal domain-containing protein n=1 Tax=Furculomyces boomerangus TaxID=61424 RepID=A0A2T9YMR0_9FUNG|nr:hypothetical protein BB559_003224 [Furculomyces boomerangus]
MLSRLSKPNYKIQVTPFKSEIFIESEDSKVPKSLITGIVSLEVNSPIHIESIVVSLKKSNRIEWSNGLKVVRIAYNNVSSSRQIAKTYVDTKNIPKDILKEVTGTSNSNRVVLGKTKYTFGNSKTNDITTRNTEKPNSLDTSLFPPSYESSLSTYTPTHSRNSSIDSSVYKIPQTDIDNRISYELNLPLFEKKPQPSVLLQNFSIDQYLSISAVIQVKSHEKKEGFMKTANSKNKITTKESILSGKSLVYGIPESIQDYLYSLPTYQEANNTYKNN